MILGKRGAVAGSAVPRLKNGGGTRIRTGDAGFANPCLTTWRCRLCCRRIAREANPRDPRPGGQLPLAPSLSAPRRAAASMTSSESTDGGVAGTSGLSERFSAVFSVFSVALSGTSESASDPAPRIDRSRSSALWIPFPASDSLPLVLAHLGIWFR